MATNGNYHSVPSVHQIRIIPPNHYNVRRSDGERSTNLDADSLEEFLTAVVQQLVRIDPV
jgi:hypothetical protein